MVVFGRIALVRNRSWLAAIALVALALHASDSYADDAQTRMLFFSGFGRFGAVHSSESRADFRSSGLKPNGAGFIRVWSTDVDTLIAGQITANFTPDLSIRAGRIVLPDFLVSDYRKLGYANPWVRRSTARYRMEL